MRGLLAFAFIGSLAISYAQESQKTFDDPEGAFRFRYPSTLVNCLSKQTEKPESCITQGEICDGPGSNGSTKACFSYPKAEFQNKPMFVAAAFYVSEIQSAKNEEACLNGSADWFVISSKPGTTTINRVLFRTFEIGDNWAGSGQSGPAYRTFHAGKCWELGIQTVIARAAYDPESHDNLTEQDRSRVENRLKQALHSFVFLK
jgi:hypothetical protein